MLSTNALSKVVAFFVMITTLSLSLRAGALCAVRGRVEMLNTEE